MPRVIKLFLPSHLIIRTFDTLNESVINFLKRAYVQLLHHRNGRVNLNQLIRHRKLLWKLVG